MWNLRQFCKDNLYIMCELLEETEKGKTLLLRTKVGKTRSNMHWKDPKRNCFKLLHCQLHKQQNRVLLALYQNSQHFHHSTGPDPAAETYVGVDVGVFKAKSDLSRVPDEST